MKAKIGDKVSLEDNVANVVLCRGTVCNVIMKGDKEFCTVDGMHYFGTDHSERFAVIPRDATERDVSDFYTPFQHAKGLRYASLDSDEHDVDIYLDLSEKNLAGLEKNIADPWVEIYPNSRIIAKVKENSITWSSDSPEEQADIELLLRDKVNVFGKRFVMDDKGTLHAADANEIKRYEDYLSIEDYLYALINCNYRKYPENDLLYLNNYGRRSFQWELWSMCNNLCTYCYLGKENRHTDKERQMTSLNDLHRSIDELDTRIYNNVSIIGGDFWQGQLDDPEVHESFMSLMHKCAKLYADKKIGSLWITCTMTLGDQKDLYEMLDIFDSYKAYPNPDYGSSGLWLCTSWDVHGRFHTPDREKNWDYHMKHIHEIHPWVKFNCTIILMEDFLQNYIDGKWSPKKFMEEYHTCLFYKQIGLGTIPDNEVLEYMRKDVPDTKIEMYRLSKQYLNMTYGFEFAPHRATMLKFLRKYALEDPDTYDRLFNIRYRADELHRNYNDHEHDSRTTRNKNSANESDASNENMLNTCGHMLNYAPYVDSNKCCVCDKFSIWESIYGEKQ